MTTNDASYFHDPSEDGPGRFTIQWASGSRILERYGADAERLIRAVADKDSDQIRKILQAEIGEARV